MSDKPYYSVVVPMYNEQGNAGPLYDELNAQMHLLGKPFEIIIVDDASTDGTVEELSAKSPLTLVRMRKNAGQSSAMDAGIKQAKGTILITMDGDGQDDPSYIPVLLEEMEKGYDVVCAWRHKRKDSFGKRFVSGGWKYLRSKFVDDVVHDAGTQFRVYWRSVFDDLDLYGEMHRFIPALLNWRGYKISEVKVNHRPRVHGVTKYSWTKIFKGFSDMLYMWFWHKYNTRPVHLFGSVGIMSMTIGLVILLFMAYLRLFEGYQLSDKIWPLVGFFFVIIGIQMFVTGVLAASLLRIDSTKKYYVGEVLNL